MISYDPLWKLLIDKKMKKLDLCKVADISTSTLAKMGKGEYVALQVIERLCFALECSIEDVVEVKSQGAIGTPIPSMKDITKIDGSKLIDGDGEEWEKDLIKLNAALGGGFELVPVKTRRTKADK